MVAFVIGGKFLKFFLFRESVSIKCMVPIGHSVVKSNFLWAIAGHQTKTHSHVNALHVQYAVYTRFKYCMNKVKSSNVSVAVWNSLLAPYVMDSKDF